MVRMSSAFELANANLQLLSCTHPIGKGRLDRRLGNHRIVEAKGLPLMRTAHVRPYLAGVSARREDMIQANLDTNHRPVGEERDQGRP